MIEHGVHATTAAPAGVALRVFLAIALIYALATLTQSKLVQRVRRLPVIAMLISGGWLAVAAGMLAGPRGFHLVAEHTLESASPLVVVALSWVGLIVGLQGRRTIIMAIPSEVWRWAAWDVLVSAALAGGAALLLCRIWLIDSSNWAAWTAVVWVTLSAASIGWSPETRSLRPGLAAQSHRLGVLVQAGAGLCAILCAELSAVPVGLIHRGSDGLVHADPIMLLLTLAAALALSLVLAMGARIVLGQSTPDDSSISVVVLAVVALSGGVAASVGLSPIAAATLTGAAVANVRGPLRVTERILNRAEPVVATMLYMLAGALMRLPDHPIAWVIIAVLVIGRVLLKPAIMRSALWHERASLDLRGPLAEAAVRQAPLAIAVAVSIPVFESSRFGGELLGIVVLTGLASSVVGAVRSSLRLGAARSTQRPDSARAAA